jgi:hypothetical protein
MSDQIIAVAGQSAVTEGAAKLAPVRAVAAGRPQSARSETVQYGLGYVLFAAGRLLRDLAVARILGPSRFGIWGALFASTRTTRISVSRTALAASSPSCGRTANRRKRARPWAQAGWSR